MSGDAAKSNAPATALPSIGDVRLQLHNSNLCRGSVMTSEF